MKNNLSAKAEAQYANAPKKERLLNMGKALVKDLYPESLIEKMSDRILRMIGENYCEYLKAGGNEQLLHSVLATSKVMLEKKADVDCLRSYRYTPIPKDIEAKCKEYIHWVKRCKKACLSVEKEYGWDVRVICDNILSSLEYEVGEALIEKGITIPA